MRRSVIVGGAATALLVTAAFAVRGCEEPRPRPKPRSIVREKPAAVAEPEPIRPVPPPEPARPVPAPPAPPPAASAPKADLSHPGSVIGTVKALGDLPARKRIRMDADPKCAGRHESPVLADDLVVDREGRVRWAFVYVKKGLNDRRYDPPAVPVFLEQVGCMYRPHVFGVQARQPLVVRNGDDLLHNAHFVAFLNRMHDAVQGMAGREETFRFSTPEVMIKIKCDVHPWMTAWAGVLDHPFYAVTDELGGYAITGLPAGRYVVEVWHERLTKEERELDVPDTGQVAADFLLRLKSDSR